MAHGETSVAMPPPFQSAFVQLLSLEKTGQTGSSTDQSGKTEYFRARRAPFKPLYYPAAFGGHVYAQSAWAASLTVDEGFVLHNISGQFIRPGGDEPLTYTVRHVRNGSTYCFRGVDACRGETVCFTCLCSFKTHEKTYNYGHQKPFVVPSKYRSVLEGKDPSHFPRIPFVDIVRHEGDDCGDNEDIDVTGIEARKADMAPYAAEVQAEKYPERYRQLQFYHLIGIFGEETDGSTSSRNGSEKGLDLDLIRRNDEEGRYDNLYIAAHLFQSDRNSLFIIPWALRRVGDIMTMAALSHTVIFHTHGPALRMVDWRVVNEDGKNSLRPSPKWFTMESRSSASGENRGIYEARLWAPDGTLIATAMQDGFLRLASHDSRL
ncbi:hypothetical protein KEM56_006728 [Ascosphaera pollenicola]|nr:hypothetical protein KEM56_006728 [Ascosphaera pollenicola]